MPDEILDNMTRPGETEADLIALVAPVGWSPHTSHLIALKTDHADFECPMCTAKADEVFDWRWHENVFHELNRHWVTWDPTIRL